VILGTPSKEIALVLGISVKTVTVHLSSIYRKLGAKNRAHAVAILLAPPAIASEPEQEQKGPI
jgi:DNA-binding CsgD family transcriptional regulator